MSVDRNPVVPLPMILSEAEQRSRGPRKTFIHKRIAAFWKMPEPYFCMRCGFEGGVRLDRAHIIDRDFGGVDALHNMGLLCWRCHGVQYPTRGYSQLKYSEGPVELWALKWFGLDPWGPCLTEPSNSIDRRIHFWRDERALANAQLTIALANKAIAEGLEFLPTV